MAPKLLMISHVLPYPGQAGQELRVRYMVEAAAHNFEVDFLTFAPGEKQKEVEKQLGSLDCHPLVLPSRLTNGSCSRLRFALSASLFALRTGMKTSNYRIGNVELSSARIRSSVDPREYSAVIYEYFHAVDSVPIFRRAVTGQLKTSQSGSNQNQPL